MDDAPALATARLMLEPLRAEHASELAPVLDDPRLHAFTGGQPLSPRELKERYRRLARGRSADGTARWFNWIVRERTGGRAVGVLQATCTASAWAIVPAYREQSPDSPAASQARAELAWTIAVPAQRRGYAREAATAVAEWLTDQGVAELVAHIHPEHAASIGVARAIALTPTEEVVDGEVRFNRLTRR